MLYNYIIAHMLIFVNDNIIKPTKITSCSSLRAARTESLGHKKLFYWVLDSIVRFNDRDVELCAEAEA